MGDAGGAGGASFQQMSELHARKDALRDEHARYVAEHPELKHVMSDFLSQVLLMKPADVRAFAKEYFAAYLPAAAGAAMGAHPPLCISGPSGAGKGSLVKKLFAEFGDSFGLSVSHTTRRPREGEVDGQHYHFVSHDAIKDMISRSMFIEYAHVHTNTYGTSVKAVQDVQGAGKICVLEIDIQGVSAVRKTSLQPRVLYIAPPSFETLEQRLRGRGTENDAELAERLKNAKQEMAWLEENADRKLVNDDLERAYQEIKVILSEWYPEVFQRHNSQ